MKIFKALLTILSIILVISCSGNNTNTKETSITKTKELFKNNLNILKFL